MALYSILEKPGKVYKQKERPIDPKQEFLHYGYNSKWTDVKKINVNLRSKKAEEMKVVPTRSVAKMKIPVLVPQAKKLNNHSKPGLQSNSTRRSLLRS